MPFTPGGSIDLTARLLQAVSKKHLGQIIVVENKPGGSGALGGIEVAGARRDGYTLAMTTPELILLPHYDPKAKYDYPTALSPMAQVAATPIWCWLLSPMHHGKR